MRPFLELLGPNAALGYSAEPAFVVCCVMQDPLGQRAQRAEESRFRSEQDRISLDPRAFHGHFGPIDGLADTREG